MKDMDIHFTDDQGNEFYVGIRKGELSQIWKNKMDIPDFEVYVEELDKNTPMTATKTYPTYISHNQYGAGSAISLSQNEVTYNLNKLPESLKSKLYGVIGWADLTSAELHQINNVRHDVHRVGDTMMKNLLKTSTLNFKK